MNIIVFYRSREQTNSIVSSTRQDSRIINLQKSGINIDYLNLDKRNYQKYLKQLETLPNKIFLWFDEEVVSDYIKENYPSVEIVFYNKESSVNYNNDYWGTTKEYKLTNFIIDSVQKTFKDIDVWEVNERTYEISKKNISEFTYKSNTKSNIFDTKDKAIIYAKDSIQHTIQRSTENIKDAEEHIVYCKKDIARLEKILKKL